LSARSSSSSICCPDGAALKLRPQAADISIEAMSVLSPRTVDAPPAPAVSVLIADEQPLLVSGARRALERDRTLQVIGEASGADQLLALLRRRRPELLLLDLRLPGRPGGALLAEIRRAHPEVKVVVLAGRDDQARVEEALRLGAAACLPRSVRPSDLPSLLRQVAAGALIPLTPGGSSSRPPGASAGRLTERERTILEAVARGKTTAAISRELWVSEHTVKFHLTNVYRKLGVSNRAGAIRYALQHDLAA
jgi:DNA-binding NarL/FixJ family response regulator